MCVLRPAGVVQVVRAEWFAIRRVRMIAATSIEHPMGPTDACSSLVHI